jgi:hypothetical protein
MVGTAVTVSTLSGCPKQEGARERIRKADINESDRYRPQSANHRLEYEERRQKYSTRYQKK